MSCVSGTCGVGGWDGPIPGDPSNEAILSAVAAFGGIDVTWNFPATNPFAVAYTKLYRGTTAVFASAVWYRDVAGTFYYDKIDTATRYYYWIEFVSVHGTVGATIGPATAIAKPTIEGMLELLTGQIDDGLLAISLKNQLDQISILNTNLLNEITDRETGETTLAAAIADAQAGIAEAHTFIIAETNSRVSANDAIVEQINGVAAALGDDIAAVVVTLTASIDDLTGEVSAMYMAQVTVNGLVGGFGIINDGATVEAGFDCDTFWVGRTSADKIKPFIVSGGTTYITDAAILELTFTKLRDESGSFIVEDGVVKAEYLQVDELSALSAELGTVQISDGGYLRSGVVNFTTGSGFALGWVGGEPYIKIGDSTAYLRYRPSTGLEIKMDTFTASIAAGDYIELEHVTTPTNYTFSRTVTVVGGVGTLSYQWSLTPLVLEDSVINPISGDNTVTVGCSIRLLNNTAVGAGRLRCTVTDANGRVATAAVYVSVAGDA